VAHSIASLLYPPTHKRTLVDFSPFVSIGGPSNGAFGDNEGLMVSRFFANHLAGGNHVGVGPQSEDRCTPSSSDESKPPVDQRKGNEADEDDEASKKENLIASNTSTHETADNCTGGEAVDLYDIRLEETSNQKETDNDEKTCNDEDEVISLQKGCHVSLV